MNNNTWKVTIGKFEDWEALENRKNIKTTEGCDKKGNRGGILTKYQVRRDNSQNV